MSRYKRTKFRGPSLKFYDFSTGGGLAVTNPALTVATGAAMAQTADGIRLQWTAATSGQMAGVRWQPPTALDFTDVDVFSFEFDFHNDPTFGSLGSAYVLFKNVTGGSYATYWKCLFNSGNVKYGRRTMRINKADFSVGLGSPTWSNIACVEIHWQRSTRATTVVPLDLLFKGFYTSSRHQRASLIFTFDDDDASQYTEAWLGTTTPGHCLKDYGWKGSFFVNSGSIGSAGKMTLAQLQTLRDAGCGIYSHTHSHIANSWQYTMTSSGTTIQLANTGVVHGKITGDRVTVHHMDPIEAVGEVAVTRVDDNTLTYTASGTPEGGDAGSKSGANYLDHLAEDSLRAEIKQCLDYLVSNGFPDAGKHYAYPYGYHSDRAIAILRSLGIKTARTLATMTGSKQGYEWSGIGASPIDLDWYRLPARSIGSTFSGSWSSEAVANILTDIDAVVKYGGTIIMLAHNLTNSLGATRDYSITNFAALLDAIKYRERLELLQVVDLNDYYEGCLADAA